MTNSPVPAPRCRACDGPTQPGFAHCFCCTAVVRQLHLPPVPVTAVTPYRLGDPTHRLLRGYKDAPLAEERASATASLADLVHRWLLDAGGDRLRARAGAGWDLVVGVPSSGRQGRPPVDAVIGSVPGLGRLHRPLLVRGPEPTGHLKASRRGFALHPGWRPDPGGRERRALVVDDTFVTGARAQSAAAALRSAGLEVVGVLVIGRVVDPGASPWQAAYWEGSR